MTDGVKQGRPIGDPHDGLIDLAQRGIQARIVLDPLFGLFARLEDPVDFDAIDEQLSGKGMVKLTEMKFFVNPETLKGPLIEGWQRSAEDFVAQMMSAPGGRLGL